MPAKRQIFTTTTALVIFVAAAAPITKLCLGAQFEDLHRLVVLNQ